MIKRTIISFIIAALFGNVHAQRNEVVATVGDFFKTTSGSLSWTLGEIAIETYSSSGNKLTQGMQQSTYSEMATEIAFTDPQIKVYPNPAEDQIYLSSDNQDGLSYQLYDLLGVVLSQQKVDQPDMSISLRGLTSAMYLLQVKRDSIVVGVFKIIKK